MTYRILVFGKAGCDKCKALNKRLDTLLAKEEWHDFEKVYCDVETADGLVAFCKTQCVNPSRVPAMVVTRRDEATAEFEPIPCREPGATDMVCKDSRLYTFVGLQTDYSDTGKGLITPKMIANVLEEARGS